MKLEVVVEEAEDWLRTGELIKRFRQNKPEGGGVGGSVENEVMENVGSGVEGDAGLDNGVNVSAGEAYEGPAEQALAMTGLDASFAASGRPQEQIGSGYLMPSCEQRPGTGSQSTPKRSFFDNYHEDAYLPPNPITDQIAEADTTSPDPFNPNTLPSHVNRSHYRWFPYANEAEYRANFPMGNDPWGIDNTILEDPNTPQYYGHLLNTGDRAVDEDDGTVADPSSEQGSADRR